MRRRVERGLGRGGWLLLAVLLAVAGCGEAPSPIRSSAELRLHQIYDASAWLRRVPVELAVSLYARSRLSRWLDGLDLPPEVRRRVQARLDADDFVDELVPFLLFVRELYTSSETALKSFDEHVRSAYRRKRGIPGLEHALFRWQPEAEAGGGPALPELDKGLARELVVFYDALYLSGRSGAGALEERLVCEGRATLPALAEAVTAVRPAVRGLLAGLAASMSEVGEVGPAIDGVLRDDSRLTAASAALVRFVDQAVCRHYRFFAARAFRARQLADWLTAELGKPGGGLLWAWLEHANHERRYAVLVVVDGLQGRLVESLVGAEDPGPFLREIAAEQAAAGGVAPAARSLRSAPATQTRFLAHLLAGGYRDPFYLPFFRGLLAGDRTHWVPVGVSTTPTISVRNIPIALTGAPVAGEGATGLPNFHFVERGYRTQGVVRGRAYYFFGSDAAELTPLVERAGMRTLFQRLPQLTSMACTAQYDEAAQWGIDAFLNLALGEKLRDFGDRLCVSELRRRADGERALRRLRERLLELREPLVRQTGRWSPWRSQRGSPERRLAETLIEDVAELEQRTLPELLVYYNPWPDHFAHFEGPFSDAILSPSGELNRLDYWLEGLSRAYEDGGVAERTAFAMAGDHGLAPVFHLLNPEVEVFDALREEGVDFRVEKISSDEGEGPKLTDPFDPPAMKGIDVVVASTAGGNYMLDLFRDQGEGFLAQPLLADLQAVRPLAAPAELPALDLIEVIAERLADSLDYLAVREEPCGPNGGSVRLVATRSGRRVEAQVRRVGTRLHYSASDPDLLETDRLSPYETHDSESIAAHRTLRERCMAADTSRPETWCDAGTWRRLTSFTPRPDSVVQIGHLYDSDRAGSVNLFPRPGVGYNSTVPGRHAGESFHEKNALAVLWGRPLPPRAGTTPLRSAPIGALAPTLFAFLSGELPQRGSDGWGYAPLPAVLAGVPDGDPPSEGVSASR